ncbi:hypothetical protein BGZ83_006794 [Gryganskiella cystojenkinii]|nr:hypothetical protein BGZ83_006794 [Gryganskiella cystojenkinii]
MEQHDPAIAEEYQQQIPASPHSDASTISCPNSPEPVNPNPEGSLEELASIQEQLQTVLEYVDHGMILKSFDTLSHLTDIVVTNCERLGLTTDSDLTAATTGGSAIDYKAGFWTGLNNCWLFAFSHYGNARSEDQRIRESHLHLLHTNVKAWANSLERYGLVNYEIGLWEQDILDAIEVCLISKISSPFPDE